MMILVREFNGTDWHVRLHSPESRQQGYVHFAAAVETPRDWPIHPSLLCRDGCMFNEEFLRG